MQQSTRALFMFVYMNVYKFPTKLELRLLWLKACNLNMQDDVTKVTVFLTNGVIGKVAYGPKTPRKRRIIFRVCELIAFQETLLRINVAVKGATRMTTVLDNTVGNCRFTNFLSRSKVLLMAGLQDDYLDWTEPFFGTYTCIGEEQCKNVPRNWSYTPNQHYIEDVWSNIKTKNVQRVQLKVKKCKNFLPNKLVSEKRPKSAA
ncbi:hypothetical protein QE152_g36925 [Popillia japonica]|uniref:Uncharacterized protein n=1 Tax=Popillia japonica TaxID=7064 RepID=A0AAW1IBQ6_POPJA